MNKLKRFTLSLAALMLFSGVGIVTPALAHDGESSGDNTTTTNNSGSGSSGSSSGSNDSTSSSEVRDLLESQFKLQGKLKNEAAREASKEHNTEAQREKACTARKANLTKRMNNAVSQAKKHKAVFDKIYTRVQNFYTTKKLNVTNYDTLKTQADTAQQASQASIDALSALNVNVDCTSQTVADSVSAFQQAVTVSRDTLKAYRKSLVSLITALKGASTSTDKSTNTDTSTNTESQ